MDPKTANSKRETETQDEWEYTSNEEFKSFRENDLNIEVVGFVDKINASRFEEKNKESKIMTFIINNASGSRCTVCAWNQEIQKIESTLELHNVIRIEGAKVIKIKNSRINIGIMDYQLKILKNTEIILLKNQSEEFNFNISGPVPKVVSIKTLRNEHGYVKVEGYIKTVFKLLEFVHKNGKVKYVVGSITDGEWKVEIKIKSVDKNDKKLEVYKKGNHVTVVGNIKTTEKGLVFISIEDLNAVELASDKELSFSEIFRGFKPILKTNCNY